MSTERGVARRVLVADDVESMVLLMKRVLESEGHVVETASDGLECLEKTASFRPELVVLDIMMPKLHGLDVLKRIKSDPTMRDTGVIICTAKSYKPDEDLAMAEGAFAIIEKPFRPEALAAKAREFFSGTARRPDAGAIPAAAAEARPYKPALSESRAKVRLWGTRGSIPVSGKRYSRYGGNTSCLSIERGADMVIIDAGSGIRDLGIELAKRGPARIHLFIGHTHWDHIQGFPFFIPAYIPGFEIVVYGASGFGKDLESVFRGQLDSDYFPVQMEDMRAALEFRQLDDGPVTIGSMKLRWEFTHHPGATLCYKVETGGKTICYMTDNEFLKGYLGHPFEAEADEELIAPYGKIIEFVAGSDLLLAEAQYTNEEYRSKIGWGHSSVSNACLLAKLGRIRDWVVVHHDPQHDDDFVEEKLGLIKQVARELGLDCGIRGGFDGMIEYLD
jgi:CheY-like chemotaxis protein